MKKILAYKDGYTSLYESLNQNEKDKVDRVMILMQSYDRIPAHYIRFLRDGIFELRISIRNKELRFLFIYDGEDVVILLNCFVKKTRKTPKGEIEKAIRLKKEYEESQTNE